MTAAAEPAVPFTFGESIQVRLLAMVVQDRTTSELVFQWISEAYLVPQLRWMWRTIIEYRKSYGVSPSWAVLEHVAASMQPQERAGALLLLSELRQIDLHEASWIRGQIIEWVKACVFVSFHQESAGLYSQGKIVEAYDRASRLADELRRVAWTEPDRSWFFEELPQREARRSVGGGSDRITTGIQVLDAHLSGGNALGEVLLWIAPAKGGKSTILANHGIAAVRGAYAPVLHFVLEGSRRLAEDRYEAGMMLTPYSKLRNHGMDSQQYARAFAEYQHMRRLLVLRTLSERWDYTILDVQAELTELRDRYGWVPSVIILDYIDIMHGRQGPYRAGWESERDAVRDFKLLINRGFVGITASQAKRGCRSDDVEDVISSDDIAGSIEKVRAVDTIGSINATEEERKHGLVRLHLELCRDAPGWTTLRTTWDQQRMRLGLNTSATNVGTPGLAAVGAK